MPSPPVTSAKSLGDPLAGSSPARELGEGGAARRLAGIALRSVSRPALAEVDARDLLRNVRCRGQALSGSAFTPSPAPSRTKVPSLLRAGQAACRLRLRVGVPEF
jgi:hypothetical protein